MPTLYFKFLIIDLRTLETTREKMLASANVALTESLQGRRGVLENNTRMFEKPYRNLLFG